MGDDIKHTFGKTEHVDWIQLEMTNSYFIKGELLY
jgi:hypothetical protein